MSWLRLIEESLSVHDSGIPEHASEILPVPAASEKHGVAGLIKTMWPAYLIEIFVIILGISITLALEEWRDNSKEDHLEQIYLKNLLADIDVDAKNLNQVKIRTEKLLAHGQNLLRYTRNPSFPVTYNQVSADIRAILDRPKFISHDASFSDLKSSGNLHLLKDIPLKNLLFAYYGQTQNIREVQDAEQQATITLAGSYFFSHFSLFDSAQQFPPSGNLEISGLINHVEFLNNVLLRVLNRKELLEDYQKADSLSILLRESIAKKAE